MSFENLLLEENQGIGTIKINRPKKLNALNIQTLQEIGEAVNQYLDNDEVVGMILTGEGDKAFAAGADVAEFSSYTQDQAEQMAKDTLGILNSIENAPKPIIAAINGFALGGGCELAMACHLRIATSNARFGQPEVGLGLIPGYGGTQRMTQLIGKTKAMEYLLTGDKITAAQAENMGLINRMVEPGEMVDYCYHLFESMKQNSPLSMAKVIKSVNDYYRENIDGFETETQAFSSSFGTHDFKAGVNAFLNKSVPEFKGE